MKAIIQGIDEDDNVAREVEREMSIRYLESLIEENVQL